MISAPVFAYPNSKGDFLLDTDASGMGIGAVLSQVQDGQEKVIGISVGHSQSQKEGIVSQEESFLQLLRLLSTSITTFMVYPLWFEQIMGHLGGC